jgi:hypothetical protein
MELPKTLITETTLTTTVTTIEITSGIDASYNSYEFLVMNGRANITSNSTTFLIGQSGTYSLRDNSISRYGNNIDFNSYFGPFITNIGGANLLLRAVFSRPSGSSYPKTVFVHGGSNFANNLNSSSIVLAETTQSTAAVDRVRLTVSAGTWSPGTRYKLYGYE